jgi:glycerate kinase
MHILIAPNAFKNSLTAADAAKAIEHGLTLSRLECTTTCFPIADGGDGTGSLIIDRCKGTIVEKTVADPLGRPVKAQFGLIDDGKTAVIEMADASGLRLLKKEELNPMLASSAGTGELIGHALDVGVNKILVAMGGSATVDGGCGMLSALGVRFFDANDQQLLPQPQYLEGMSRIDVTNLDKRIADVELIVLCDVDNQLLGEKGAAAVFGPQKGATKADVLRLDAFLSRFDRLSAAQLGSSLSGLKYGGTAGGAAAGAAACLGAQLVNGIAYFLEVTGFDDELKRAGLVITGEGSIDRQTLHGKGPFGVAKQAKLHNIPVIGLAGSVPLQQDDELDKYFDVLMAIGNQPADLSQAFNDAYDNLVRTARVMGNLINTNFS